MNRLLKRGLVALIVALFLLPTAAAGGQGARGAKADLVDIEDEVMCIVCSRPLSTSGGDAAEDQRAVIQGLIDEGLTKQQVKDRLVAEYGEQVLVDDQSPIAAAAPIIAAVVGATSIWLLLRRRRVGADGELDEATAQAIPTDVDPGDPFAIQPTSPEDNARIDAELADRG